MRLKESPLDHTSYTTFANNSRLGFDILGLVTGSKQTTDGVTYGNGSTDSLMTYSYNLSGALIEQQYPSGRKVQNTVDANGDLEMVRSRKDASSGYWAYANNFTYNAAGAVTNSRQWPIGPRTTRCRASPSSLGSAQRFLRWLSRAWWRQ